MTRENKAGLAVAGVFLTLVTTVGVMKWRGGPSLNTMTMSVPPVVELEPEPPKVAKVAPKPVEKTKAPQTPAPAPSGPMPAVDVVGQMNATPLPSGSVLPGVPSNDLTPKVVQEEESVYVFQGPPAPESSGLRQMKNETTAPSGLPAVPGGNLPAPEIISPPPIPQPNPSDLAPPVGGVTPKASAAPLPGVVPAPKVKPAPPIIVDPSPAAFPPVPGDAPPPVVTPPPPVPSSPPGDLIVVPPAPPVKPMIVEPVITPPPPVAPPPDVKVVPPSPMNPIPAAPIPSPMNPVPAPATEKTSSGVPLERSRFVPTVTVSPPRPLATQPPMAGSPAPKADVEPAGNREPVKPPVAPSPTDGLRQIAVPPPSDLPLKPVPVTPPSESRSTLPSSSLPSARTNVVQIAGGVVSAAPATPKVTRVDTSSHVCKQEDTWESISAQHLLSKNWADALRAYNMQSRFQNERVRTSGVFQPGDTVFIPPASVLEANFPTLIRKQ